MDDKHGEIFRQYDLKVYNTYRARGAFLLETNQGIKLLKSFEGSKNHLIYENKVKDVLINKGITNIDLLVPNKVGEYISDDSSSSSYIIRNWFSGEECNLKELKDVQNAAKNLATIHMYMQNIDTTEEEKNYFLQQNLSTVFEKHNKELKRVRTYIWNKKQRNEFENNFLILFDDFYKQALNATKLLGESQYESLYINSCQENMVCHGNYNYHNLLVSKNIIATTNFDKCCIGVQITDLYQFLRKCMEKNNWSPDLGAAIIDSYNEVKQLSKEEIQTLYLLLLYPEKFWKVTNYYFNNKKSWISKRNIQKLMSQQQQAPLKAQFLKKLFSDVME
ncbi:MAG: CotS family spore coat protein [bacterium]|nr:CotS family spore coat protein [bacterium]